MIVTPHEVVADTLARRLGRFGAAACVIGDHAAAAALLPERRWHAVVVDRAIGGTQAQAVAGLLVDHAERRLVLIAPGERHELPALKQAGFTGYLVKPVRAASLAARLTDPIESFERDAAQADEPAVEPASSGEARPANGLAVLVAEDNAINALLARALLLRLGHRPTIAENGRIALETWLAARAAGAPYDLVLMDLNMPDLDGVEATRRIRQAEHDTGDARVPIIALTANALDDDRDQCVAAGMNGFLAKPLDRERLAEALATGHRPTPNPLAA